MKRGDIEKLLGGYASDTLTEAERAALFEAALEDQELFDALMAEEPLRELMAQPAARARMMEAVGERPPGLAERLFGWMGRPAAWAAAGSLAALVLTVGLVHFASRQRPAAEYAAVRESAPAQLAKESPAPQEPAARLNEQPARRAPVSRYRASGDKAGDKAKEKGRAEGGARPAEALPELLRDSREKQAAQMPATQMPSLQAPAAPEQVAQAPPPPAARPVAEADEAKAARPVQAEQERRQASASRAKVGADAAAPAVSALRGVAGGVVGGIVGGVPGSAPTLSYALVNVGPDGVETAVSAGQRIEDRASVALSITTTVPGSLLVTAGGRRLFPAPEASPRVPAGRHLVPLKSVKADKVTIVWMAGDGPLQERHEIPLNFR